MANVDILIRAAVGGAFIAVILMIGQTRHSFLAGLLLFFPIISVPTFYFMGQIHGPEKVREAIVWGAIAIPVWCAFAATLYWASHHYKLSTSLLLGLGAWLACAALLVAGKLLLGR